MARGHRVDLRIASRVVGGAHVGERLLEPGSSLGRIAFEDVAHRSVGLEDVGLGKARLANVTLVNAGRSGRVSDARRSKRAPLGIRL